MAFPGTMRPAAFGLETCIAQLPTIIRRNSIALWGLPLPSGTPLPLGEVRDAFSVSALPARPVLDTRRGTATALPDRNFADALNRHRTRCGRSTYVHAKLFEKRPFTST